jgi:HK97 gp10 family phage protein
MHSQATTQVVNNAIEKFRQRLTPKVRAIGDKGGEITESLALQLVAVKTGALKGTIVREVISPDEQRISAGGGEVDYAGHVEHGTENQEAQPYMRPATQETRRWMNGEYRKL